MSAGLGDAAAPGAALAALVGRIEAALDHRGAPGVVGVLAGALVWWLLGTLAPLPWVYDEAAYLLQAEIFASGRWAGPGRPLPEFFEQFHVFVTPRLVPKYPPGHALLLVPGLWVGAPGLVPMLATAVSAGLAYRWIRRLANGWVAALATIIWLTAPEELYIRPGYMSQVTSTLVWLLAWALLDRWRRQGRARWLAGFSALAALAVLIRPITAAALILPAGAWVLWRALRGGAGHSAAWRQIGLALATAVPILAIAPAWSLAVSGRAFPTPYSEYSRVYAPWNMPGFSVDGRPPLREPTPALRKFQAEWLPVHQAHRLERLPVIAAERLRGLAITFFGGGVLRWLLLLGFVLGLSRLGPELRFGLVSLGTLFLAHLWIAARPLWTVYYLEAFPVIAAVTAVGAWRAAEWSAARHARGAERPRRGGGIAWPSHRVAAALAAAGMLAAVPGTIDRLLRARVQHENQRLVQTDLSRAVDSISGRAIVFVAPGPAHRPYESYVRNVVDLEQARVWVVQDRGADNGRLLRLAPDRKPYRFDPGSGALAPLPSSSP